MSIWRTIDPYVAFVLWCRAQPKERHDKKNRTPVNTRVFEQHIVGAEAKDAMLRCGNARLGNGASVGLRLKFYFVSHEPDLSNIVKSIEDGCNGIVFSDDKVVKYTECEMLPCTHKDDERVECEILWL